MTPRWCERRVYRPVAEHYTFELYRQETQRWVSRGDGTVRSVMVDLFTWGWVWESTRYDGSRLAWLMVPGEPARFWSEPEGQHV